MWVAFANAKATHIFFSKKISLYAIVNDQRFNGTLTNDIVCFVIYVPWQVPILPKSGPEQSVYLSSLST